MVYDKKLISARELYDAIMSNWEGKEDLRQTILNEAPHYGNDNEYVDVFARWVSDVYGNAINSATGPRGRWAAGLFPVTAHVLFGMFTGATPDGRKAGEPLSDGIRCSSSTATVRQPSSSRSRPSIRRSSQRYTSEYEIPSVRAQQ